MPLPHTKFREIVFQMLYSYDMSQASDEDMLPLLMEELAVTRQAVRQAQEKVHSINQKLPEIDSLIATYSHSYEFERIQTVEKNILRLAVYEMLFDEEIPEKVAIAEALRLAKKFGTPESVHYVNGVIDCIYKKMEKNDPNET